MRHHHKTVELCPSSEASPWGLREITPLHEAPPRGLRGITSWPWGTTTLPSWNYVLPLRHHHELSPSMFMELSPIDEAPPITPTRKVHGIMSIRWGTTMSSHYKSHGITPYSHFVHVSPTNQKVPIIIISCINNQSYNSCFPIHTQ